MTRATPRRTIPYRLFAILLMLDVLVLVIEKTAALHAKGVPASFYLRLITQPWLWCGLALGPLQLWVWTRILARTELSLAYPVSSLSYPLTMVAAQLVFRESLSLTVWVGALFITLGVAIVSSTAVDHNAVNSPLPL